MSKENNKPIILTEYQYLHPDTVIDDGKSTLGSKRFEALESFVLKNDTAGYGRYLKLGHKNGIGKVLQAQKYIGVIQLKDGTVIEILPKIANKKDKENHNEVRQIVVKMLKTLRNSPFKNIDIAHLTAKKMPLLEIFIGMFLQDLTKLVQRGIKNDYITREENSPFLKGKLIFSEHIKKNTAHKERFFVAYDNYLPDRIENRIIKTTLQYLYSRSRSSNNQQRIREFQFVFDELEPIHDVKTAFSKVKLNRQMQDYEQVLMWSKLFLLGNSFAPHKGNDVALSLLFDMNLLFESYVGHYLQRNCQSKVSLQHKAHHLVCQNQKGKFALKPDIVIDDGTIIADTKWKLLSENSKGQADGISQADLYQMFAYGSKYQNCKDIYLIYPAHEDTINIDSSNNYQFHYNYCNDSTEARIVTVHIVFFDLAQNTFAKDTKCLLTVHNRTA